MNHDQYAYVADFYKTTTLRAMWDGIVMPVPDPTQWVVGADVLKQKCEPPENPRQAGRPRESRHPSGAESSTRSRRGQLCGRCHTRGHNRVRCTCSVPLTVPNEPDEAPRRRKKKCDKCQSEDHTRPKCPERLNLNLSP